MAKIVKQKHGGSLKILEKGETANPNGRPRKGIALVNKALEEKGYSPAKRVDIENNYMQLLQLTQSELKELVIDEKAPMLIRVVAKSLLSGKGFDVIEKMLDRGIGRTTQIVEQDIRALIVTNPLQDRLKALGLNGQKNK